MAKCNKCGSFVYDLEAAEFVTADAAFDAGEFSGAFEREWCECDSDDRAHDQYHEDFEEEDDFEPDYDEFQEARF
jgi:hypothetical protein